MTEKLEQALARVRQLPEDDQNFIAAIIMEELDGDARWDELFANSPDVLKELAAEVDEAARLGKLQELDPDTL